MSCVRWLSQEEQEFEVKGDWCDLASSRCVRPNCDAFVRSVPVHGFHGGVVASPGFSNLRYVLDCLRSSFD